MHAFLCVLLILLLVACHAKEFTKAVEELRREVRTDLRTLKESVKEFSDTCNGVNAISSDVKELRREVQALTKNNHDLRIENERLTTRIEELEHYKRSNNLELKGMPLDGNPKIVVFKIVDAVGSKVVRDADIDVCHRVPAAKP